MAFSDLVHRRLQRPVHEEARLVFARGIHEREIEPVRAAQQLAQDGPAGGVLGKVAK